PAGRIVLITDGAGDDPAATLAAAKAAAQAGYRVNVIGVGTQAGSPLLAFDGGVLRARDGTVVTTRMDETRLREIAAAGRGSFSAMTVGDGDLDTVLAKTSGSAAPLDTVLQDSGLSADQWLDMGPWLLLGVLALAPLAFRRGWIAVLMVAALGGALAPRDARAQGAIPQGAIPQGAPSQSLDLRGLDGQSPQGQDTQNLGAEGSASAGTDGGGSRGWDGLWRTPDQQGADAFGRADYGTAARSFESPQWQASALYKSGSYDEAAAAYAKVPDGDYNRGNALARAGKLEEAIKAYDAALAAHPGQDDPIRADALFNRELVQKVLDQRKKDQQKKDQDKKDQDKKDQKSGTDQKPKDEPGKDEKKDKPQKPGDEKKPDQPPPTPDPKGTPQKPEPQKPEPPKAPQKPEPPKPEPQKPEPQKPNPQDQKPPEPPPEQPPPPSQPPQPGAPKPLTEEDQNRAQTLRLVPDDPTGLLRARIRSHYG
ncbi:MAG: hypothetical protein B7Y65_03230, partial [Azorhizobium sp. 35-67-15]